MRLGWAKKHPIPDKSLESVKNTVREQWEQEQTASRGSKPAPSSDQRPGAEAAGTGALKLVEDELLRCPILTSIESC